MNIIIGAGPAGVSAGLNLAKHGNKALILEKESNIGGLSKTLEFSYEGESYKTDTGPHRFFSQNPVLYDLIEDLLGDDWLVVDRLTRQYIDGKYFNYPVDIMQALRNVDPFVAIHMVLDYVAATVKNILIKPKKDSFEQWIVSNFGRRLAEFNMLNYTEKIWGIPCSRIAGSWAAQRIKGMNALDIIKKAMVKSGGPRSMVNSFYYPKHGIQQIYDTMLQYALDRDSKLEKNISLKKIFHNGSEIKSVEYESNGDLVKKDLTNLISSMPITELVQILEPAAPDVVIEAARKLSYRDQVQVFLIIDKPHITEDTWIYFPTTPPTYGRLMEPKNWVDSMAPKNRSSLLVEYFVFKGDSMWKMDDDQIIKRTMHELEWLGFVRKDDLLKGFVIRNEKSYPMWDVFYEDRLKIITDYLDTIDNLYCVGRNGRFFYNNQDHSIETGLLAAQSIIDGKKYDLNKIGMEDTYFEAGMLYK